MGNSKPQSDTEFPSWAAIEAFEKLLNEWLEKIAAERRGGLVVEEFIPMDGSAEKSVRAVTKSPCDYSPPLLKLKYNNAIADAFADLGTPDIVRKAFVGSQCYLYQG